MTDGFSSRVPRPARASASARKSPMTVLTDRSMQRRALLTLAALSTTGLAHAQPTAKPRPPPSIRNTEPHHHG
jgi:hypothetical protein